MNAKEIIKAKIRRAFAGVEYPGDSCLRSNDPGEDPYMVEECFRGKTHWQKLDAGFIDHAPYGLGCALSFMSDEAFRFYLPAYLMADLDGKLEQVDPASNLCLSLDAQ